MKNSFKNIPAAVVWAGLFLLVMAGCEPDEEPEEPVTTTTTSIYGSSTLDINWISIPGGTFEMGCNAGSSVCMESAQPLHTVDVSAFELTELEITLDQYIAVTGDNASWFSTCADCPVERVNWYEAGDFCAAIGGRLPTEAEWEYAARAGTDTAYLCGSSPGCLQDNAWFAENSGGQTQPGGRQDPNDFGLYDMSGNVWEWVQDCWNADYIGAPTDGSVWDAGNCASRVLRGGSWDSPADELAIFNRDQRSAVGLNNTIGFRCAR